MQQRMQLIGGIIQLMIHSPLHRQYTIEELERRFMPCLLHNQFRYYEIDGSPIGFVNWAWIDDAIEPKYQTGKYELALDEWQGGSNLWFPEMIAPFGHTRHIIQDLRSLRNSLFPGAKLAKSIRLSPVGKLRMGKYRDHPSAS
ncbi:toxin-activating lysine-acyltransferase [filamentous cyanobacterium LEGE 11480]|uniref:RTX toxin-activating lysine-acyltransferase n=2 Tax=Romeriopsis TaxID=2992131 RepID=A0A928VP71_9CYAN|nr:toxin-activating lysine-acyltransferase [Romeriopsis navalis LEGE 11480]